MLAIARVLRHIGAAGMVPRIDRTVLTVAHAVPGQAGGPAPATHAPGRRNFCGCEHGALPRRDENLARFTTWTHQALARLPEGEHRDVVRRFSHWHLLRRMHGIEQVSNGTYLRSKQTVTVAIDFLTWLDDRETTLQALAQADLHAWQAGGPTTREIASRFLAWAIKTKLVDPQLRMQPHRRGTSPTMSAH